MIFIHRPKLILLNKRLKPLGFSLSRGFTIVEAIMTVAIFSLMLIGVSGLVMGIYRAHYYTFQQAQAIEEARNGIGLMIKEIREAKLGDDGSYIIERANDYEFIFYGDINKDNKTERVRYFIDGTDFKKAVIEPTGFPPVYITDPQDPNFTEKVVVLSKYIRNSPPIFHYFDGNLQELPAPARLKDTKLMSLYLVINVDPNKDPQNFVLRSSVQLRNLKTNL